MGSECPLGLSSGERDGIDSMTLAASRKISGRLVRLANKLRPRKGRGEESAFRTFKPRLDLTNSMTYGPHGIPVFGDQDGKETF
jgi:hypothetical protein